MRTSTCHKDNQKLHANVIEPHNLSCGYLHLAALAQRRIWSIYENRWAVVPDYDGSLL